MRNVRAVHSLYLSLYHTRYTVPYFVGNSLHKKHFVQIIQCKQAFVVDVFKCFSIIVGARGISYIIRVESNHELI